MKSINDIVREVVKDVSEQYGRNVSFLFGDWDYIANQLVLWGTGAQAKKKYPIVCLRSPIDEPREGKKRSASLDVLILVNTLKNYTNEQRESESFVKVLRPIYELFMEGLGKHRMVNAPYSGLLPHVYTENYRYGRLGLQGGDDMKFKDFVDAIEIKNLSITIKDLKCYE